MRVAPERRRAEKLRGGHCEDAGTGALGQVLKGRPMLDAIPATFRRRSGGKHCDWLCHFTVGTNPDIPPVRSLHVNRRKHADWCSIYSRLLFVRTRCGACSIGLERFSSKEWVEQLRRDSHEILLTAV